MAQRKRTEIAAINVRPAGSRPRTVKEAAEALNLSEFTIRAWIASRRLGCTKLGRAVRVTDAEIDRVMAEGTIPALR